MDYAYLVCHRKEIAHGRHHVDFEWSGPANATIDLSLAMLHHEFGFPPDKAPERLTVGGYPLCLVDVDEWSRATATYARTDGLNRFSWMYWRIHRALRPAVSLFFHRCIMTLHVWGLAYVPANEIPSLPHIGKKNPYRRTAR